ncbi:retinol dehydrogenase 11-like [Pararge aegeria]|uniref:Jg13978 protein n=1 Tax=Pararge aegeria aegeria TaxID=348720 RepID=A0A8S4R8X1_9NEOP|nr:retinol dehydrogenase 11-like [Pararge aegeria]CAH2233114.1 jg13978 [Pararge aegeria aegeria]
MLVIFYVLLAIVIVAMVVGLYQKNTNIICKSKKRLDGKTAIVTGGTSGMGLRIAMDFADRGARVIVACPFVDEGAAGRKLIVKKTGNEEVIFKLLDLSSNASIRKFAEDILATEKRLDILINNAGVGTVDEFITKDGLNFIMQVNYFGAFLLTLLLLPMLKKTGSASEPARIVNTTSVLHNIGTVNFENMNKVNHWYLIQLYGNSKLCLVLFTRELTKRLKGANVVCNSVDPGAVGTTIFNCSGKYYGALIMFLFSVLFKTPWEGAQTAIHTALDKKAGLVSGEYFKNCRIGQAKQCAYDENLAQELWEESVKLVKLCEYDLEECFKN